MTDIAYAILTILVLADVVVASGLLGYLAGCLYHRESL